MIEEHIEYHKKYKVESDEEIWIHDIRAIERLLRDAVERTSSSETIRIDEYHHDFASECEWLMEDVPAIKPLESPEKYSEYSEEHKDVYSQPCASLMDVLIPVGVEEIERSKSCDHTSYRHRGDIDDLEVYELLYLTEVDKVGEYIERVREEEEP